MERSARFSFNWSNPTMFYLRIVRNYAMALQVAGAKENDEHDAAAEPIGVGHAAGVFGYTTAARPHPLCPTAPNARIMTMHSPIARGDDAHVSCRLVTAATRCWRAARDAGRPLQQALHTMLAPSDHGMLAPVFDSLLTLCEAALGRRFSVGGTELSDDEHLLLGLLDGSMGRRACIDCEGETASMLDCAICSTRIMLGLVTGRSLR